MPSGFLSYISCSVLFSEIAALITPFAFIEIPLPGCSYVFAYNLPSSSNCIVVVSMRN